ncbi:MAG: sensor histidine kinase [Novosphingobium sp.]
MNPDAFRSDGLLAASPNPYVVFDRDLNIAWLNDAYASVTMRARDEVIGRNLFEAFPADPESDSYRQLSTSLYRVLETGERDEIALIHYPIQNPDGTMSARYWSATHTPLRDTAGGVAHILQHTVDVTELHELRTMRDDAGLMQRARAVEQSSAEARAQLARMRTTVEQAPGFVAILMGPQHRFELANAAYRGLVGDRDLLGKSVAEALPEVVDQGFVQLLDNVYLTGESYIGRRVQVRLKGESDDTEEERFLDFIYQPIFGGDDKISGVYVQGQDVTEETLAADQQRVLINELNHRVKNTLAIVQGLAMQSFRKVEGGDAAYRIFNQRLDALAAAHTLLTDRKWQAARLFDVLTGALAATGGDKADRCAIRGEDSELGPQTAVSLAMLLHELATNAIKYGALSNEAGTVEIETSIDRSDDEPLMRVVWREHGGPPVVTPEKTGFGTRLIRRGVANHRRASVEIEYLPGGLVCTIVGAVR